MIKKYSPAFPMINHNWIATDKRNMFCAGAEGLSKRELLIFMAMQGLCANSVPGSHHSPSNLAKEAIVYADAVLAELEKEEE